MTNEEMKKALCMIVDGASYQEVADELGTTKQNVSQVCKYLFEKKMAVREDGCIYPNIYVWLRMNRVSKAELARRMDISYQQLYGILNGKRTVTKERIDQMLEITGMTYEEAFKTEKE